MPLDRRRARQAFAAYAARYDADDPKVKLKIDHTYRVAALCERIAASLDLPPAERDLAWLCGLLHDIGRFEQLRRYGTFNDAQSIDHAAMSARVLFDEGHIAEYLDDRTQDEMLRTAVAWHSGRPGRTHAAVLPDPARRRQGGHPARQRRDADGGDLQRLDRSAAAKPRQPRRAAGVL